MIRPNRFLWSAIVTVGLVALAWPANLQASPGGHGKRPKPGGGKSQVKPPVKQPPGGKGGVGTGEGGTGTGLPKKPGGKGQTPPKSGPGNGSSESDPKPKPKPVNPGGMGDRRLANAIKKIRAALISLQAQWRDGNKKIIMWTKIKKRAVADAWDKTKTSAERQKAKQRYEKANEQIAGYGKKLKDLLARSKILGDALVPLMLEQHRRDEEARANTGW